MILLDNSEMFYPIHTTQFSNCHLHYRVLHLTTFKLQDQNAPVLTNVWRPETSKLNSNTKLSPKESLIVYALSDFHRLMYSTDSKVEELIYKVINIPRIVEFLP